jgi:predicted alpha/beta-hydrolase family hydrolase
VRFSVALVEQPYRVAGRRSPAPAHQLDTAWRTVVEHLLRGQFQGLALISGGRSSGARVACRTAADSGARGVLCLAFPLITPQRSQTSAPKTRQPELDAVTVPVLVVQGDRDQFGQPAPSANRRVVTVRGNHSLRSDLGAVGQAAGEWLASVLA